MYNNGEFDEKEYLTEQHQQQQPHHQPQQPQYQQQQFNYAQAQFGGSNLNSAPSAFDNVDINRGGSGRLSNVTPFGTVHEFVSVSNKV